MNKAERIKRTRVPAVDPKSTKRLPPGQALTERFPILHEGDVPVYDLEKWDLKVFGEIDKEVVLLWSNQTNATDDHHRGHPLCNALVSF